MFKKNLLYFVFLLFAFRVSGQVNLQTGSATFSVPMFNWQDDKSRLYSAVALSYNSGSGLKVDDVASNAGQGWNLMAGGNISRMQVGEPDDQQEYGYEDESDISKYPNGILFASVPASEGCPEALTKYPIYKKKNQVYKQHNAIAEDKERDYFAFQFNGKAGMFVLDSLTSPTTGVGVFIGDTKMKVTFQLSTTNTIRTRISSFSIYDVDGLIYKFSVVGLTKVLQSNYCNDKLQQKLTQPKFENNHVYYQAGFDNSDYYSDPNYASYIISSWHLSEIEDALTHRKVVFTYYNRNVNTIAGQDISYNSDGNYALISYRTSKAQVSDIYSISYPDGHLVIFNYNSADRIDLSGAKALSSVEVSYQGRYLSKYLLNTTYFILNRYGTPVTDYQKSVARLCLKSVQKIGVDLLEDTPPYIFDYYLGSSAEGDNVPPPYSYAKDIWGYYNGKNSKNYSGQDFDITKPVSQASVSELRGLCYMRNGVSGVYLNANPGYARNGLLKQIIYPTGGTLTYEYEQNYGIINGNNVAASGVHVSKTSSTDGGYQNGCDNPINTQYNYVLDGGASSLWGLEMPVNYMAQDSHYKPEQLRWVWPPFPFGACDWKYEFPGILSLEQGVNVSLIMQTLEVVSTVVGIVSTIIDISKILAGTFSVTVIGVIIDIILSVLPCILNHSRDFSTIIYYNSDLNGVSPLPTQFKRVEIVENPGTIGKTIQEFTSSDDYAIWEPTNPTFSSKQRFAPWAYGLPKKTTVVNQAGEKVKEIVNVYNFNTQYYADHYNPQDHPHYNRSLLLKEPINITSCKCLVKYTESQRSTEWNDPDDTYQLYSDSHIGVDIYQLYTGRTELDTTYERVYSPGGSEYVENKTVYVYNDENYEPSFIKNFNSDGTIHQKNIYYSIDYTSVHGYYYTLYQTGTSNTELSTLVQNNIISLPVASSEIVGDNGWLQSSGKYFSDKVTQFVTLQNGDIKPSATLEARFIEPTTESSYWQNDIFNTSYFFPQPIFNFDNPNYSLYKITQSFSYDASGNLISQQDEGNRQVTNIYDYNDKYVVAAVINADPVVDKPAYTSFETSSFGGWTLIGNDTHVSNSGITGIWVFNLNGNILKRSSLNTSKSYIVSFWANNNLAVGGGATLVKSGTTFNGFTYYEYEISQGASSVSISGNGYIDELRIYPANARMRTITYDPIIGKTAECDENNRITYYEYDNLGRLRFIKDEAKNIVKMYEYNNVSAAKQNGCPGIYYNKLISEQFVKDNCGSGYIGGTVPYTVAANTYSSTISQEDADAQAENQILTEGQTYANTHGSCIQIFYNAVQYQVFQTQDCPDGYVGGNVTYTVPANTYSSLISQQDANDQALEEIESNGQAFANDPGHAVCVYDTTAVWVADEGAESHCIMVSGQLHVFKVARNVNPHSATYNQTQLMDTGESCSDEEIQTTWANNSGASDYTIVLSQSGGQYFYAAYEMSEGGYYDLGYVPVGTYSITIYQWPNQNIGTYYSAGCASSQFNFDGVAYFNNVTINASCNVIQVY